MNNPAPTDPLRTSQWYLQNVSGPDLNVTSVWPDYTGAGVHVAILDDGFDITHPDLAGRFNASSYDFVQNDTDITPGPGNYHGTTVVGILGAASNASGIVGVAYNADLVGLRISFGADGTEDMYARAINAASHFDIINNSWGYVGAFSDDFSQSYFTVFKTALTHAVQAGRDGLGSVIVFAAGNNGVAGDNTNYHNAQNASYTITVAAIDIHGNHATFSNPGTSILVSAPGVAVLTTDANGTAGIVPGDYANGTGTSYATPMVSGIVALMLEANPDLGYRDVQEILAYAARKAGSAADYQTNGAGNWNGGGLHYSSLYGFGLVDAHAAVRMAENWTLQSTAANQLSVTKTQNTSITIPDTGTAISHITFDSDVRIDHMEISIDISHANTSQLKIILIAPNGTQSVLADHPQVAVEFPTFTFSTVADWGENARGTWTLQVSDTIAGTAGILNTWSLTALGDTITNNDLYIYTDENVGLIAPTDTNGGIDTINAAALTKPVSMALNNAIENLVTGDGNDFITGNASANTIHTGRGNDIIHASAGNDIIDGGAGTDTYQSDDVFNASVTINAANDITLTSLTNGATTRLENIENFSFAGVSYDLLGVIAASHSGTLTDVIYAVHGVAGVALRHSSANGFDAYTAQDLHVGGDGIVLLSQRDSDHLTLTNNAGGNLGAISMRMDDGLHLTIRGFGEVSLIADGTHATAIDIAGGQRGLIQTGSGNDSIDFLAFLIDQGAPAQNRTLSANTGAGDDSVHIIDRSSYLAYDVDLGAGNDHLTVSGTQSGHIMGGSGSDTFTFGHNNGQFTGIYDFSALENDHLDLSLLLEGHNNGQTAINSFIQLEIAGNSTNVKVDNAAVVTLYGTILTDSVQHYLDTGLIITHDT